MAWRTIRNAEIVTGTAMTVSPNPSTVPLLSLTPLRRMPLLIAGTGRQLTIPIVARHADAWHASFPDRPAELRPAVARLRSECAAIGRDVECVVLARAVKWFVEHRILQNGEELRTTPTPRAMASVLVRMRSRSARATKRRWR